MGVAISNDRVINAFPVTFDVFKKQNEALKKKAVNVRIENVDFKQGLCQVKGPNWVNTCAIIELLYSVLNGKHCITNLSALNNWKGWQEAEARKEAFARYKQEVEEYGTKPTYFFKKGDKVQVGLLTDPVIDEVLWDGMAYVIDFTNVQNNYGKPIVTPHCKRFATWYEVRPIPKNTQSFIRVSEFMRLNYSQRQLGGLIHMIYNFGVDFEPEYQRGFVWNPTDKVRLIDSIFHGVDIGKFVFVSKEYSGYGNFDYEILDGKQRLKTLQEFYENKFAYKGCYYNDLTNKDKNFFENYSVSYAEVRNISDADKYNLFILLNTSGHVMEQKHLDYVKQLYAKETGHSFE